MPIRKRWAWRCRAGIRGAAQALLDGKADDGEYAALRQAGVDPELINTSRDTGAITAQEWLSSCQGLSWSACANAKGNEQIGSGLGWLGLGVGTKTAGESEQGLKSVGTSSLERGLAYDNPSNLVQNRVNEIQSQIPVNSQGRITMGVAVVEDANGVRSVLVSTSEPRGYLRPGVSLQEGEKVVVGTGHAEADIVSYANANGLKIVDIGATRPVCASCQNAIEPTGANVSTPLKPLPKAKQ